MKYVQQNDVPDESDETEEPGIWGIYASSSDKSTSKGYEASVKFAGKEMSMHVDTGDRKSVV